MRVRTYGFLLLLVVGVAPLTIYGALTLTRARVTSEHQIRAGHVQVARAIAGRVGVDASSKRALIAAIGAAVMHADSDRERQLILDAYVLGNPALQEVVVYDRERAPVAQHFASGSSQPASFVDFADRALRDQRSQSQVITTSSDDALSAHTIIIGEPVVIVGARVGAIVARYDLVGVWPAVNSVRVGETGFIRLLSYDGRLLAHGHPEERRWVFDSLDSDDASANAELVSAALLGTPVNNLSQVPVVASLAIVPGFPGVVVVEQEVSEAFSGLRSLERNLLLLALAGLAFAILIGVVFGRELVHALEIVRRHVELLPGNLNKRLNIDSRLVEVQKLADTLDTMAGNLQSEREEAKSRARLTTFARVAAGLAHDLRMPIDAVRGAVELVCERPDEPAMRRLLEKSRVRDIPRLTRFMDDLQRLAHEGNPRLEYESVRPAELAAEVRAELAAARKWSGVHFEVIGTAGPAELDRNLLRRALLNLAGNGADACLQHRPSGQVTIEVDESGRRDVHGGETGDDFIVFRISDTGVGIEPERIESLKHSDFQSTKRTSGVGLGLGVVRQVLDAHAGSMEITSTVGVGSQFTIILPRQPPSQSHGGAPENIVTH